MKTIKLFTLLLTLSLSFYSCDTNQNKDTSNNSTESKFKSVELGISGMTCEVGCAKTIESKISKMKGVRYSKVSFNDSIGYFTYNTNLTSLKTIITKIDGIADGKTYKVIESKEVVTFVTKQ